MVENGKDWRYPLERQHTVNNPKLFGRDIELVRRMAYESMFMTGITVDFFRCNSDRSDFYQDPKCTWETPISVSANFEDNPRVKTLKNLGWYNEDEEIRPPIIYLPIYLNWNDKTIFQVTKNSLIRVHYFGQNTPSEFRITEVKMDSVYGNYWICKLAPERLDKFVEVVKDGSHFIRRDVEYIEDSCEHYSGKTDEEKSSVELTGTFEHDDYENYPKNSTASDYPDYFDLVMGVEEDDSNEGEG